MKLYHGTTDLASALIDSHRHISCNAEAYYSNTHAYPTEQGFVYLTNHPGHAAYMGNKHSIQKKCAYYVVYEIEIPESELLPDYDELQYIGNLSLEDAQKCTFIDSIRLVKSCRINKDLKFVEHVKRKLIFEINSPLSRSKQQELTLNLINLRRAKKINEAINIVNNCQWVTLI